MWVRVPPWAPRIGFRGLLLTRIGVDLPALGCHRSHEGVRLKNGRDSTHLSSGREIRALRRLKREYPDGPYVFATERGGLMTSPTCARCSPGQERGSVSQCTHTCSVMAVSSSWLTKASRRRSRHSASTVFGMTERFQRSRGGGVCGAPVKSHPVVVDVRRPCGCAFRSRFDSVAAD